jgi:hypothetical protein
MTSKNIQHPTSAVPGKHLVGHYLVVTGHNGQAEQVIMTRAEKANLTMDCIDFHYDRASGDMFIRLSSGKVKHFRGQCPLGTETYSLLEKILMAGSDYVPLVSENWQYAQVSRIRAVFEDPPGQDHFFEVQKYPEYCIRVRPEIRWRIITVRRSDDS